MAETGLAPSKPQTLDDVMIAMDVVDTLRHREDLVRRELNEEGRESELIARLRQIYRDQGIEVPDQRAGRRRQGAEGQPLRLYAAAAEAGSARLLTLWAKRETYGKRLGIALAALVAALRRLSRAGHAAGPAGRGAGAHRDHRDAAQEPCGRPMPM